MDRFNEEHLDKVVADARDRFEKFDEKGKLNQKRLLEARIEEDKKELELIELEIKLYKENGALAMPMYEYQKNYKYYDLLREINLKKYDDKRIEKLNAIDAFTVQLDLINEMLKEDN